MLMLIVGTSDVIHIMSKYIDELKKGREKYPAMVTAIKEIGVATFLTSITTAIGFATLITSNVRPIREFGLNAALGVLVAYVTVIFLTTSLLVLFSKEQIIKETEQNDFWKKWLSSWYATTLNRSKTIVISSVVLVGIFLYGMSLISMNYRIESNLPKKARITDDFKYFEDKFSGFRPIEFAVMVKDTSYAAGDYEVQREVAKLENHLSENDNFKAVFGLSTLYKSMERMNNGNQMEYYRFPEDKKSFNKSRALLQRTAKDEINSYVNADRTKTRLSSRVADIGAEKIKEESESITQWINTNIDTNLVEIRRTGTGLLVDKNSDYIRESLFSGLGLALAMVSLLMALLFKNFKMLIIALIPNIIPVLFAAALLGFFGIELEAGVSIIFAVVFGIAVDDTIHFLSKYKLMRSRGHTVEESIKTTFMETGKAITFTTIILFFGFLVMLFSNHPPSVTVGLLISITLVGALVCDLLLLPIVMRKLLKD